MADLAGKITDVTARCIFWIKCMWDDPRIMSLEERLLRYAEESTELLQSGGLTEAQVIASVKRVYSKPPEPKIAKEVGGVFHSFLTLCYVLAINPAVALEATLADCYKPERMEEIKHKHNQKVADGVAVGGETTTQAQG